MRRSMAICLAPLVAFLPSVFFLLPRRRFSIAIGPFWVPSIVNLPMRVRRMTSPADMQPIIASQ
jgi:hypothetical protein